jgi:hypothetical protein
MPILNWKWAPPFRLVTIRSSPCLTRKGSDGEAKGLRRLPKFLKSASLLGVKLAASWPRRLRCAVGGRAFDEREALPPIASPLRG